MDCDCINKLEYWVIFTLNGNVSPFPSKLTHTSLITATSLQLKDTSNKLQKNKTFYTSGSGKGIEQFSPTILRTHALQKQQEQKITKLSYHHLLPALVKEQNKLQVEVL